MGSGAQFLFELGYSGLKRGNILKGWASVNFNNLQRMNESRERPYLRLLSTWVNSHASSRYKQPPHRGLRPSHCFGLSNIDREGIAVMCFTFVLF
jgi:hypothetical protein